jgi:hypothetical protein
MSGFVPCPGEESRISIRSVRQRTKSSIRATRNGTPALVGQGALHSLGMDRFRFRSSPLGRALVVLAATILMLIVSAIVLPPNGSQAKPGESDGEAPVTFPQGEGKIRLSGDDR